MQEATNSTKNVYNCNKEHIMNKTFLFYDIETSGLSPCFDQIIQFAAIRSDLELNEIERYEWHIQLRPDVVPSPHALIVHGISAETLSNKGEPEGIVIPKIHKLMNTPGTISLGYNTLGFDDEFLRFSFYRNLLPPYTHQYANQCSRADIYPITVLYYLFGNSDIAWPKKNDSISLKLENLNDANQLAKGSAHNALVDVEATIALAKRFFLNQKMWSYALGYFDKAIDLKRMNQWIKNQDHENVWLYLDGSFGAKNQFQAPVLLLGNHRHYKNQILLLRLDLTDLERATLDNFQEQSWVIRKKVAEPGFLLPLEPRFLKHLDQDRQTIVNNNLSWLRKHPEVLKALTDYYLDYTYPNVPEADLDTGLYQKSFWSDRDNYDCEQFHKTSIEKRDSLIDSFSNTDIQNLAIRWLGRNYPETLSKQHQDLFNEYLKQTWKPKELIIDYRKQTKYTADNALKDIATLENEASTNKEQMILLKDYREWLENTLKN